MNFEDLEDVRLKYLAKHKKVSKILLLTLIPVGIIIFIIITIQNNALSPVANSVGMIDTASLLFGIPIIAFFIAIPYLAIISIATHKEFISYKRAYKIYFVARSFASIFANIKYDHNAAMPEHSVRQVMVAGDRYSSNDYLTATYKNINFAQADVHTEEKRTRRDANGHIETYYVTIFRGRFFIFDFNRNFDFAMQVRTKSFPRAITPRGANPNLKFHKLETESIDFNQDFEIYGQDGVDAFYILDPAFIEKLHNLYHTVGCELAMTFMDSKLYIAANNHKDAFEAPNPKKPLDEKTEIEKVSRDIRAITGFVDNLDLDNYNSRKAGQ